jgi:hypothetical protein
MTIVSSFNSTRSFEKTPYCQSEDHFLPLLGPCAHNRLGPRHLAKLNGLAQCKAIYMPSDDSPIQDVNSQSMACNGPPVSGFRVSPTKLSPTVSHGLGS